MLHKFSAGGIVIEEGRVLTIKNRADGVVSFPKGTPDGAELPQETALREVKEETGYDVTILDDLGTTSYEFDDAEGRHWTKTVQFYVMALANGNPPTPNLQPGEDLIAQWLDVDEAFKYLRYDDSKALLRKALDRLNR